MKWWRMLTTISKQQEFPCLLSSAKPCPINEEFLQQLRFISGVYIVRWYSDQVCPLFRQLWWSRSPTFTVQHSGVSWNSANIPRLLHCTFFLVSCPWKPIFPGCTNSLLEYLVQHANNQFWNNKIHFDDDRQHLCNLVYSCSNSLPDLSPARPANIAAGSTMEQRGLEDHGTDHDHCTLWK